MKNIETLVNHVKELQREYEYGSAAYNVLRKLETTIPAILSLSSEAERGERVAIPCPNCVDGKVWSKPPTHLINCSRCNRAGFITTPPSPSPPSPQEKQVVEPQMTLYEIIEKCKRELLKHLHPMTHSNGYPCEAVAKSTILSLPALFKIQPFRPAPAAPDKGEEYPDPQFNKLDYQAPIQTITRSVEKSEGEEAELAIEADQAYQKEYGRTDLESKTTRTYRGFIKGYLAASHLHSSGDRGRKEWRWPSSSQIRLWAAATDIAITDAEYILRQFQELNEVGQMKQGQKSKS